jgi:hypothetical protein
MHSFGPPVFVGRLNEPKHQIHGSVPREGKWELGHLNPTQKYTVTCKGDGPVPRCVEMG